MMFLYFIIFIFGLIIGSFLNCLIYRLEQNKSPRGRSFCPQCKHMLAWYDLIPVLSFILLRRKCRYCKQNISWQYPAVEMAAGFIFFLIFNQFSIIQLVSFQTIANLIYLWTISAFLLIIFVFDLKHYIIPDKIIYSAIVLALLCRFLHYQTLTNAFLAGLGSAGFFFLIWLVSRGKWLGFGDVKLALFMGLFLGFPDILPALFLAFGIGAIIGIGLMVFGKKKLKSQVPFGPFLIVGTFLALFWGHELISWYLRLI